jgi:hypothetical protein
VQLKAEAEPASLLLCSAHGVHVVCAGAANVFGAHAAHAWFPGAGLCAPAPHARHVKTSSSAARSNPGMQTQSPSAVPTPFGVAIAFAKTAESAGHARQASRLVEPVAGRYESLGHGTHPDMLRWCA